MKSGRGCRAPSPPAFGGSSQVALVVSCSAVVSVLRPASLSVFPLCLDLQVLTSVYSHSSQVRSLLFLRVVVFDRLTKGNRHRDSVVFSYLHATSDSAWWSPRLVKILRRTLNWKSSWADIGGTRRASVEVTVVHKLFTLWFLVFYIRVFHGLTEDNGRVAFFHLQLGSCFTPCLLVWLKPCRLKAILVRTGLHSSVRFGVPEGLCVWMCHFSLFSLSFSHFGIVSVFLEFGRQGIC